MYGIPSPFDSHFLVLTLVITFAIQLSVWAVSAIARCESAYDAAGAVNYVVVALLTFGLSGTWAPRQALSTGAVVLCRGWLGIFLLIRVVQRKGDVRFEEYRKHWWQVRCVRVCTTTASFASGCPHRRCARPPPPDRILRAALDCVCNPGHVGLALRHAVHRAERRGESASVLVG